MLATEIQEFVDHWRTAAADGEWTPEEIKKAFLEGFDVVRELLSATNTPAERAALAEQLEQAIAAVAQGNRLLQMFKGYIAESGAGILLEAIESYSSDANAFWREKVNPWLATIERTAHSLQLVE